MKTWTFEHERWSDYADEAQRDVEAAGREMRRLEATHSATGAELGRAVDAIESAERRVAHCEMMFDHHYQKAIKAENLKISPMNGLPA